MYLYMCVFSTYSVMKTLLVFLVFLAAEHFSEKTLVLPS